MDPSGNRSANVIFDASSPPDMPLGGNEKEKGTQVAYLVEYRDWNTDSLIDQHRTKSSEENPEAVVRDATVIEIVTVYKRREDGNRTTLSKDPITRLRIHSKAIINALQTVVDYYPGQELSGEVVEVKWPFAVLVHHEEELEAYRQKCAQSTPEVLCRRDHDTADHIAVLQDFLERNIMPAVREERERNAKGLYTWELAWINLRPGSTIHTNTREDSTKRGYVVRSLAKGTYVSPPQPWVWELFYLSYNGLHIGRTHNSIEMGRFDGEWEMEDSYTKVDFSETHDETTKELIRRGSEWYKMLTTCCKHYDGMTRDAPERKIDSLVMVDMTEYYRGPGLLSKPLLSANDADSRTWVTDCTCPVCQGRKDADSEKRKSPFSGYDLVVPEDQSTMSDLQYFLCEPELWCFVFKDRTWASLAVQDFSTPIWNENMIGDLVMPQTRVDTLKALAKSYVREDRYGKKNEKPLWTADFVQGKGQGLIFLLHGKPGVGKTCTAECIAAFTRRPLMVLTSSDIGTDSTHVENILTLHFRRAKSWGAVLLIDEADVFMQRRSIDNLARNSLVAGFLRALEFYDGILFLTTNRVGTFDDAFISRIHIQLYYHDLSDDDRSKIWKTFQAKLKKDRKDMFMEREAREYLESSEMKEIKWNGREIRNAFQTAVALAEYDAEKDEDGLVLVREKHLKSVVEMSKDFKKYLSELHEGDEDKRAESKFERLGSFKGA